jgi:hypothetical protein
MSEELKATTLAAAKALEAALNEVENDQAIEVASMLIMLTSGFLRAVAGAEWVKGFLEDGVRDMDKPPILKVVALPMAGAKGTKH